LWTYCKSSTSHSTSQLISISERRFLAKMVSLQTVQQSNALIKGLIALFIGATSGIGQSALQQFTHHASSPRIYTVARPSTVPSHENLLSSLRQSNPGGTYNLITADVSLVSEIDKVVNAITQKETKLDILFMSTRFMAFEGRKDTGEGLDPSMTTRYYSRLRAVQKLLPLLNNAQSPRIISVLAGGMEGPLKESDLDLRDQDNWSFWNASVHATTMGTLSLERLAKENPRVSIVHWFPGPVAMTGLASAKKFGMSPLNPMSVEEAGARAVFLATCDRYAVQRGLVPMPDGLENVKKSGRGIFLVNPLGESTDNERVLAGLRERGVDEEVWTFMQQVYAACEAKDGSSKDEL
jgi:NAD(P)-dependent dehydrogenase (short-subunit alcohol dehydrogenase family)